MTTDTSDVPEIAEGVGMQSDYGAGFDPSREVAILHISLTLDEANDDWLADLKAGRVGGRPRGLRRYQAEALLATRIAWPRRAGGSLTTRLEPAARAIAAAKRGCAPNSPEIDAVWTSYLGQARACIAAVAASAMSPEGETPPPHGLEGTPNHG